MFLKDATAYIPKHSMIMDINVKFFIFVPIHACDPLLIHLENNNEIGWNPYGKVQKVHQIICASFMLKWT